MASRKFVDDFNTAALFFRLQDDEKEAFRVLCRGNMDAATIFVRMIGDRARGDHIFNTTERIRASIAAERAEEERQNAKH